MFPPTVVILMNCVAASFYPHIFGYPTATIIVFTRTILISPPLLVIVADQPEIQRMIAKLLYDQRLICSARLSRTRHPSMC